MKSKLLLYVGIVIVVIAGIFKFIDYMFYIGLLCIAAYGVHWAFTRGKEIINEKRNTRDIKVE
ncbi:MAG: hypothetical protein ACPGVB_17100 [Chitinophagales bacterium]